MPYVIMISHSGQGSNRQWEFTDLTFEDGNEAGAYAKNENAYHAQYMHSVRYKALKVGLEDPRMWKERIKGQIESGELKPLPWVEDAYYKRYCYSPGLCEHIDPDNPSMVRFVASPTDGMQGRFTSMTPGRFIRRYIGDLEDDKMDRFCAMMGLDMTTSGLLLAKTPEEVVRVYTEGPHSCMAYKYDPEDSPFRDIDRHPVECYGDSDLAVAYIERAGEIKARCMVWPEKKIHGRIYGDRERLLERLRENDYVEQWDFIGARIRQLYTEDKQLILPYIDSKELVGVVKEGDDWLVLTDEPTIIGKSPYGLPSAEKCQHCGKDAVLTVYHGPDDDYDEPEFVCADGCS